MLLDHEAEARWVPTDQHGKPRVGRREWLDELGKRILKKHPGPKNEYISLIIYTRIIYLPTISI